MYLYSRLLGFRALGLNFDQRDRDWVYLSTFMYILTDLKHTNTHQALTCIRKEDSNTLITPRTHSPRQPRLSQAWRTSVKRADRARRRPTVKFLKTISRRGNVAGRCPAPRWGSRPRPGTRVAALCHRIQKLSLRIFLTSVVSGAPVDVLIESHRYMYST